MDKLRDLPQFMTNNKFKLSHRYITSIHVDTFILTSHVENLDLSHNWLDVDCQENYCPLFPIGVLTPLINLKVLNLSNNYLRSILLTDGEVFKGLKHLIKLNLGYNKLNAINKNFFRHLSKLITVNLEHNQFVNLPMDSFSSLQYLYNFDLSHNKLSQNQIEQFNREAEERAKNIGKFMFLLIPR